MRLLGPPGFLRSLRARVVAGLLIVALLGAGAMGQLTNLERASASDALEDTSLNTQAQALIETLHFDPLGRLVRVIPSSRWRKAYDTPGAAFFTVYDPSGRVVARSGNRAAPLARQALAQSQIRSPLVLQGPDQDLALTARAPFGHIVVVGRTNPGSLNERDPNPFEDFQPLILFVLVVLGGLASVWLAASWSLQPLRRASLEAVRIGPDALTARITLDRLPAEAVPLAQAVNGALDRLAAGLEAERRFTADAAHALRTPVAVMDLRLQRAAMTGELDGVRLRNDLQQISRLVSGLLTLARVENAQPFHGRLNLARLLRETAADLQPAFDGQNRTLTVEAPENLEIAGDERSLRDLMEALIDNALHHGAGPVTAFLAPRSQLVILTVSDQGLGVPPEAQQQVFERFHKLDAHSSGAGLGLSIVRQTARTLGGDARFVGPSVLEVTLPVAASAFHQS